MMRTFVALPVDAPGALPQVQAVLGVGRRVPVDDLHVTLAFLGNQPEWVLRDLDNVLQTISAPVLTLRPIGLDLFGGDVPSLIAAVLADDPALTALRRSVRRAADIAGIALARERFRPHVTLARMSRMVTPDDRAKLERYRGHALPDMPALSCTRFALYQSTLASDGARYDVLADYPLTPA